MVQSPVFLDTSGWIALLDEQDRHHDEAVKIWTGIGRRRIPFIVTDWVVAETGNGLAKAPLRGAFVRSLPIIIDSARGQLINIDESLMRRSFDLYKNRPDKAWGLVDCSSFVIMGDLNIRDALTADRHYDQAGFRYLLNQPRR